MQLKQFRKNLRLALVPVSLSAIFLLDILGPFDPVITVLYIPVIVISTRIFPKGIVTYLGLVCVVLTCASFVLGHVEGFDKVRLGQFAAILLAITATTSFAVWLPNSNRLGE
ncbi:hypothetical protein ASE04_11320 [Rhizobium sp. Root708]|uniref:hypothetical protein n=1 Tax=Rhizobium sp. Root708 TaxID=1736592 RepID=UPI0006FACD24|nr:hypothetical protein [Rhizobium sp. Root708]KRB51361.1 hypothetical protein ASE04_11320 [Rhizobium sp. Root708]